MRLWLILVLPVSVCGCNWSVDSPPQITTSNYVRTSTTAVTGGEIPGYDISSDRCSTGHRMFNSMIEFCEGVRSKSLNQNCGAEEREGLWKKHCTTEVFVELP
jgi:hypothetical protein